MFVGTSVHGQGHHTAFAMLASDILGIPMDKISLVNSDTARVPRGAGTMGSRSLQTAGSAIHVASNEVLERAKQIAAHLLEAVADDIVVGDGGLHVAGVPSQGVSWADLAVGVAATRRSCPPAWSRRRCATSSTSTAPTRPSRSARTSSVVEVDTETGQVTMLRHVAVDDCGRILNPLLVAGQQHGGIAQGAAQALFEEVQYDEDGNPITSNLDGLRDPVGRRAAAASRSPTPQTDSPRNPLGAKGIGESGTIGSTPAIQNAVVDAVSPPRRHPHRHAVHVAQRVWRAIQDAKSPA